VSSRGLKFMRTIEPQFYEHVRGTTRTRVEGPWKHPALKRKYARSSVPTFMRVVLLVQSLASGPGISVAYKLKSLAAVAAFVGRYISLLSPFDRTQGSVCGGKVGLVT
jgi:hypothetical protein